MLSVAGIVQHDQHALARQQAPVQRGLLLRPPIRLAGGGNEAPKRYPAVIARMPPGSKPRRLT
jgi:hypothetical protein